MNDIEAIATDAASKLADLHDFVERHPRLFVLSGAGCSTASGIPDYRDSTGAWKRAAPMDFQTFMGDPVKRARYWARSMIGWRNFGRAQPNAAHTALALLEAMGRVETLVTQNVDGLHQAAGSQQVIDLHGRLDRVRCMHCGALLPRALFQQELAALNPAWLALQAMDAPDGDADLEGLDFSAFQVPAHVACGGILKPDVVFFGEAVPRDRVEQAFAHLARADAVLVVGSSLMVYSGFRFPQAAARQGLPIAALNIGRTRADDLLSLKVEQACGAALTQVVQRLSASDRDVWEKV
ncbi:MAG: NAD-dependent protein deacetylase [Janthinobacterium lividum]